MEKVKFGKRINMQELRVCRRCRQYRRKRERGVTSDKKSKEKEHEALEGILSFFNCLFASVNFNILQRGNFSLLIMFGCLKIPTGIGVPFSFRNF